MQARYTAGIMWLITPATKTMLWWYSLTTAMLWSMSRSRSMLVASVLNNTQIKETGSWSCMVHKDIMSNTRYYIKTSGQSWPMTHAMCRRVRINYWIVATEISCLLRLQAASTTRHRIYLQRHVFTMQQTGRGWRWSRKYIYLWYDSFYFEKETISV